jgi:hypothetical protein
LQVDESPSIQALHEARELSGADGLEGFYDGDALDLLRTKI